MSAAANIFVGQAEAPLVVKPFIPTMTRSELFAVMVGGLSTIAGSVMAGYVALGIPLEYLVTASFMAAPGGLMMAKLIEPETDNPVVPKVGDTSTTPRYVNLIDAAATGALDGLRMAAAIAAMLIAFCRPDSACKWRTAVFRCLCRLWRSNLRDDSWLSTESCRMAFGCAVG